MCFISFGQLRFLVLSFQKFRENNCLVLDLNSMSCIQPNHSAASSLFKCNCSWPCGKTFLTSTPIRAITLILLVHIEMFIAAVYTQRSGAHRGLQSEIDGMKKSMALLSSCSGHSEISFGRLFQALQKYETSNSVKNLILIPYQCTEDLVTTLGLRSLALYCQRWSSLINDKFSLGPERWWTQQ